MTIDGAAAGKPLDHDALAVHSACIAVMHAYADRIDEGRASAATELFTDDATLVAGPRAMVGRDQLAAAFAAREADGSRRTRHLVVNPTIRIVDDGVAQAHSSMMLFVLDAGAGTTDSPNPNALMNCHDRFERGADDCWRIAERRVELLAGRP